MTTSHHPADDAWNRSFSPEQRAEQLEADKEAWRGIIGVLLAIVTYGVALAVLIVWAIVSWD